MALRTELYVRIPPDVDEMVTRLAEIHGSKTAAVITAIRVLAAQELSMTSKPVEESNPKTEQKPIPSGEVTKRGTGGIPKWGTRYDKEAGVYVKSEYDLETIQIILRLKKEGKSLNQTARWLTEHKREHPRGSKWTKQVIHRIIINHEQDSNTDGD